jgi:hypothetical protein
MNSTKLSFLISLLALILSTGLTLSLLKPASADNPPQVSSHIIAQADTTPPTFPANPLSAPPDGATIADAQPTFDWADASDPGGSVMSYTLVITGPAGVMGVTTTASIFTPTTHLGYGPFTWTVQAIDAAGNASDYVAPPATFTMTASWQGYLPLIFMAEPSACPTASPAVFDLIPIDGPPADHPDYLHGDFNLSLRGYELTSSFLGLVNYTGGTDANAPQLAGLFEPNRFPGISSVYRVNGWNWSCDTHGCPGPPLTNFPVTLAGLVTTPGESIFIPELSPNIYPGNFKAMVLYAEERRITLGYTRRDTVAAGYAVHLENICVDPNLLALYQAQVSADGWHVTGRLPALRNNQALGTALGSEIQAAIRDQGTFMDPRSRKDWWQGY